MSALPVVFLGPSLPRAQAEAILAADIRPPARRGDFDGLPGGAVVGLIDGVFDQNLAVSPSEIRDALERGVTVLGSSSMGALRAAEVPGVVGVGRVFEMFRAGELEDDDEVALTFDPETGRALSVPMVNIRHAVDRLVRPGTLSAELGDRLLRAAKRLWYPQRVYPAVLRELGLWGGDEGRQLAAMLAQHDLKRDDAICLLEQLRTTKPRSRSPRSRHGERAGALATPPLPRRGDVHCWEFGPPVAFERLVQFLKLTGALDGLASAAWQDAEPDVTCVDAARAALLQRLRTVWHWVTPEEVEVTMAQLGLEPALLAEAIAAAARATAARMARARAPQPHDLARLRAHLFFDDAALKRETARLLSLDALAAMGRALGGALSEQERAAAVDRLCAAVDAPDEERAREHLERWGVTAPEVDAHVEAVAWARRQAAAAKARPSASCRVGLELPSTPKTKGSRRFTTTLRRALAHCLRLAPVIGVTRVAMIDGLGNLGVPNAQAFRPDGRWSSTVGSGKSETVRGAKVGAVMEELEKWAQERYAPPIAARGSYRALRARGRPVIDPSTLDLPFDTCYRPDLELPWVEGDDLIGGGRVWVPASALLFERQPDDLYYSPHAGRKVSSTNGLASAFTLAEALTHAISEYVERHALISTDVLEANPGVHGTVFAPLVDLRTLPRSSARLVARLQRGGYQVRVRDLSAATGVPVFHAALLAPVGGALSYQEAWKEQLGHAGHPDPEVALNGALLEAAQGIMSDVAGAREDLTLHARSLGRHERTKVRRWSAFVRSRAPGLATVGFDTVRGFVSRDAARDVRWLSAQLARAGYRHLCVFDLSHTALRPARVVRTLVPGMDTVNPFYTGPRTRAGLLADLVG